MYTSRLWRLAMACRPLFLSILIVADVGRLACAAEAPVSGIVVDQSGRAVPRAYVRLVDAAGHGLVSGFADEAGRFELRTTVTDCSVEASLAGFQPATVPCPSASAPQPVRLVLTIAPVQETMIVTATRTEAPTSQIGASMTVFTADDIERRQTPLVADLLLSTPGAMVVRNGGPGSLASLFVRGGESDYNKVLLDGVPLNEPGGSFYLNNLTTENLDRIEIVRGAYSSLFGSDAMGSVIQLFTRRADRTARRPRLTAQLDGGTYETVHLNAAANGATNRVDYSLGVAQFDSNNRVPNSRLENTTLSGNVGVAMGAHSTLRFVGRGETEHVGTPGTTAFGRPDLDAFFDRGDHVESVSFDQEIGRRFRQRASYSLASSAQQSTNLVADPSYRATFQGRIGLRLSTDFLNDTRNTFRRQHASYQADWRLTRDAARGDHRLTMLADWDGERATMENRVAATRTVNTRNNAGVSVQHQMLWPRVFATLGGRIEHNESFGTAAVPRASVVYVAHQRSESLGETRIKASAGTGIKEPTMIESFSLSPFFPGNPDLKPERSQSVEIGVEQRFAADRAKLDVAWFHNRFRDIISLVATSPSTFAYQNVGLTRARGLEATTEVALLSALRGRAGYTFLDSKILESASPNDTLFGLGKPAFRRPRHSGYAGVTMTARRVVVDVNGVFIGAFVDSDFGLFDRPLTDNPGHTTWDARLTVRATSQLTGLLTIDNVTDADYSEPFGYQPLGRVIRTGIRVAF